MSKKTIETEETFKKGTTIEIGVADFEEDETGYSVFCTVDISEITTSEIHLLFNRNVLYIIESSNAECKNQPISSLFTKENSVVLPKENVLFLHKTMAVIDSIIRENKVILITDDELLTKELKILSKAVTSFESKTGIQLHID